MKVKYYYPVTADDVINIYDIDDIDDKIKISWSFNGKEEKARYLKIKKDEYVPTTNWILI